MPPLVPAFLLVAPLLLAETATGPVRAIPRPGTELGDVQLNLGLAITGSFTAGDGFFAFVVDERRNGDTDLNGDGDAFDRVLHVFDAATRTTTSLGLAVDSGFPAAVGDHLAFAVVEAGQAGTDLNGDGDTADLVVHVYDHAARTTTNLALSVFALSLDLALTDDLAFLAVRETDSGSISGQGVDLNGDGDLFDVVAHVHRPSDGVTVNLGLATGPGELAPGRVAFAVSELAQAGTDLNGDGDADDTVLHAYALESGSLWNTGVACIPAGFAARSLLAFAKESDEGADLNGDGDRTDFVLHRFDPQARTITNEGLACNTSFPGTYPLSDRWLAVIGIETAQGATDLNGDGDANDFVLHVYDGGTPSLTNLGVAVVAGGAGIGLPRFDRGLLAFWVQEDDQGGVDLNGNGTAFDDVMHVHHADLGTTTNLALASQLAATRVDRGLVAFLVSEPSQGPVDLNGDGDTQDRWVPHVYDRRTGATTNLALAGFGARYSVGSRYVSVLVDEGDQGRGDLNGDGDLGDSVYHVWNARDGSIQNLGLAGSSGSTSAELSFFGPRHVAVLVSESAQGQDLNGDGDQVDTVPVVVGL